MTAAAPIPISSSQIARLRMHALGLHASSPAVRLHTPRDVVAHHLAMQAQDWAASRWAVGSRLPDGATDADVLAAYDRGELVRSWPMRGTVHVTLAEDLPWMLELMGARALSGVQRRWALLGIDEGMLERARDVAIELLHGGGRATRAELLDALIGAGLDLTGQRAYHTVWYLAQTGTLVQGPTREGEQLLVLLDEWIPQPRRLDRDDALAQLGRRWLQARGPATVDDLVHWTKLTKGDCRRALDANADDLVQLTRGDITYVMLAEQWEQLASIATAPDATLRALAAFDEHLLGYRCRDDVLAPKHATLVDPGRNGVFRWTLVHDGQVVATWRRTRRTRDVKVEIAPFTPLPARVARLVPGALDRWSRFVGMPLHMA